MSLFRTSSRAAALLALAALLSACENGGNDSVVLHFGMHNWGDCEAATVVLDLEAAGAVLARTEAGAPDCWSAIDEKCDVTIGELDGGMRLHIAIHGCLIPASSSLVSCRFTSAAVRELEQRTYANCDCEGEQRCGLNGGRCDTAPYLCVSESEDPGSCEDCLNGMDDDGNGRTDCDDPNCSPSLECGTRSSSTTTCTNMVTSTSMPPATLEDVAESEPAAERRFVPADAGLTAP